MCGADIFLGIIAILFPPLAVWVKKGICSADSLINIALCCLGYFPGLLHAWYIIATHPDPTYDELPQQDPENGGNVTYYYVQRSDAPQHPVYGTVSSSTPNAQFPAHAEGFVRPPGAATTSAAGPSEEVPPSYQQATSADHKVQRS